MAEIAGFRESFAAGLAGVLAEVAPVLDERARRLLLGAGTRRLGRGGIKLIAAATGAARDTVGRGAAELEAGIVAAGQVRGPSSGEAGDQTDPQCGRRWTSGGSETRGDPRSPLRWTTKSTVKLAEELTARGHEVAPATVARLLRTTVTACEASMTTEVTAPRPRRPAATSRSGQRVLGADLPVISVDTKKKELVGVYKNGGREPP